MKPILDWSHGTQEIRAEGLRGERAAGERERAALARALDILACGRLDVRYEIRPLSGGRFRLTGLLEAALTQSCVVTLEPLATELAESFAVEFCPAAELSGAAAGASDAAVAMDVEPLEDGRIPVGRIVYEHLAAALDPYPRKAGVVFDWADRDGTGPGGAARDNPFSVLDKLKRGS